jgi:P pilus assembly chaperone PapD
MDLRDRHLFAHHRLHALGAVAVLWLGSVPAPAGAQQVSVQITPLRIEMKTAAGGATTQTVSLTNQDREPVRVHAAVADWYLSKDGTPQFTPVDPALPYTASPWLRINPVEVVAQPGVETTIRFTLNVPPTVAPGGYRSAIMFEFLPPGGEPAALSKGVAFRSRIATTLYVTIGAPTPAVELLDLQARVQAGQPPALVATLKNTGPVHVRTKGQVIVYGQDGQVVRRLALPDVPVLPASEREVVVALGEPDQLTPLPAGRYRMEMRVDVGLPEVLVGETTITIGPQDPSTDPSRR